MPSTSPPTVLLFDIDGTLVSFRGVGRRAFERAFEQKYGRPDACTLFRFDGSTDRAITRQGLDAIGVEASESAIDAVLLLYVSALKHELSRSSPEHYCLHAGVHEVLRATTARGHAVGLGTGNLEVGARLKLGHVGIAEYFAFGGFGDDHELRAELIRKGAERGAARLGFALGECRVVVIGDTPKDVAAAVSIGAESVAVATGAYSAAELMAHGASHAFDDLLSEGLLEVLLGA